MQHTASTKVIVGMSGGVDSSVAALLLQRQGYAVEGLFMKNWEEDDGSQYCTAREDLADAQAVADTLGMQLHTVNFAEQYWDNVFSYFLSEYRAGRTPNPDILCNREIKFRAFLDYALELGADSIATGHYVRRGSQGSHATLLKGLDHNKDQSYFLHAVGHRELGRSLFPVGELQKPVVRELARDAGLPTSEKKDSTGICFIGERRFSDFLKRYLPAQPGAIEDQQGREIGQHQGLMYHTIGQRQGLGIGGRADTDNAPWYVVDKDLQRNVLLVAQGKDHPALFHSEMRLGPVFWVAGEAPALPFTGQAKIRYRQADQACQLLPDEHGFRLRFDQPQRAVTPGQSAVLYDGDRCLGGAVIESAL